MTVPIQFHKMHGAGNDFVLLDYRQTDQQIDPETATLLSSRRMGVGCDQILVLRSSQLPYCTARYEVINADGSTAGQCGNGVRCIALYLEQRGEWSAAGSKDGALANVTLEGPTGIVEVNRSEDGAFECAMGEPVFRASEIPLDLAHTNPAGTDSAGDGQYRLVVDGTDILLTTVSMGNPHAVFEVEDTQSAPVGTLGPAISKHPAFPDGCNTGFVQWVDEHNIRLRVFERGVGETLACGSGACAAMASLRIRQRVASEVNVFLPGGHLVIKWRGPGNPLTMKGPAAHIFRGTLDE